MTCRQDNLSFARRTIGAWLSADCSKVVDKIRAAFSAEWMGEGLPARQHAGRTFERMDHSGYFGHFDRPARPFKA